MTLLGLGARNAFRNPFRTSLTILGVAIAILAFVLLRTVISSWELASQYAAKDRIGTRHKLSFVISLPLHYVEKIRQVPGVKAASYANWFGGKDARHPDVFFANMMVDAASVLDVYDELEIPEDQKKKFLEDRQGAIIGKTLASQLGLKVGDRFVLQGTIYPGDWPLNIVGIYSTSRKSIDQSSMFFHWSYVNEKLPPVRKDKVGWVFSRVDEPGKGPEVSAAIDKIFDSADDQTLTMSERQMNLSFMGMFAAIMKAVNIVSVIILLILVMILANTIAMGVRERTTEYGALRALGFLPSHIRLFILGESATLGALAGLLGVGMAVPLVNGGMSRFIEENMSGMFPYFRVETSTVVLAIALAVVLGIASGLVPALVAGRISVVNALRRVE